MGHQYNSTLKNTGWKSPPIDTAIFHWSLVIIGSTSLGLNSLFTFMFIIFRKKFLSQSNVKILLSMTLADSLVGVSSIVFAGALITRQPLHVYKLTGVIPLFGSMFTSLFSLCFMTLDRLIAIKIPLRYRTIMSPSRVNGLIVSCWLIFAFVIIQEACIYVKFAWRTELKLRGYMLAVFFTIGSIFLTISNIHLNKIIRKHARDTAERLRGQLRRLSGLSPDGKSTPLRHAAMVYKCRRELKKTKYELNEIKAAKMCIIITLIFIGSWLPLTVYRFCYSVGYRINIPWLRRLCLMVAILNSVLNPIVYLLTRFSFQKHMWRFLTRNYSTLRRMSIK